MERRKLVTLGMVLVFTGAVAWRQAAENGERRAKITRLENEAGLLRAEIARTGSDATNLEASLIRQQAHRARLDAAVAERLAASRSGETGKGQGEGTGGHSAGFVSLNKTNLGRLQLKTFDDGFRLTDEAAALLGMNPTERAAVNQVMARLIAQHENLDLAKAKPSDEHLTSESGRKTTYKVPAYPDEGKALASEMLAETSRAIGPTRTEILTQFADPGGITADGYEPFGRMEKTITFLDRETPDGQRGDCKIFLRVVDSATGLSLATSFSNLDDSIPKNWRHLIQNVQSSR